MKIKKRVKDAVWRRQKGGCAACICSGNAYYVIDDEASYYSTVLLCQTCHSKISHDRDIYQNVLEYLYYCKHFEIHPDPSKLVASEVI